jgi:hypothetical protein
MVWLHSGTRQRRETIRYIITVDDRDSREMEHLMDTADYVFLKTFGDNAVIVRNIELMDDAQE